MKNVPTQGKSARVKAARASTNLALAILAINTPVPAPEKAAPAPPAAASTNPAPAPADMSGKMDLVQFKILARQPVVWVVCITPMALVLVQMLAVKLCSVWL